MGREKLKNMDIAQAFINIDFDKNERISFEEFAEFIHPATSFNNVSAAFASTFIQSKPQKNSVSHSSSSLTPSRNKFEDDYISHFWSHDLGVQFQAGLNGINAYIKWRFTDYARLHIECGSKIIA